MKPKMSATHAFINAFVPTALAAPLVYEGVSKIVEASAPHLNAPFLAEASFIPAALYAAVIACYQAKWTYESCRYGIDPMTGKIGGTPAPKKTPEKIDPTLSAPAYHPQRLRR